MTKVKRKWIKPGVPHKGWVCLWVESFSPPEGICEMCGKTGLRYLHTMQHAECIEDLRVGCDCAERMEDGPDELGYNSKDRERALKNWLKRRQTWIAPGSRSWKTSRNGNSFTKVDGRIVIIIPSSYHEGRWAVSVDRTFGRETFRSEYEARTAVYERFYPRPFSRKPEQWSSERN